jgi:hypothetical protein
MNDKAKIPVIFSPDNEPYLGRISVCNFDKTITCILEHNLNVARFTRSNKDELSDLQSAACQLIPHGINLSLSIRELVRQGYLYGAAALLRPLVEKAAIISYLCENNDAILIWKTGWEYGKRPSFAKLMNSMNPSIDKKMLEVVCQRLHSITHGDPDGSLYNVELHNEKVVGHSVGKILNNPDLCDSICFESSCYMIVLLSRMVQVFPRSIINEVSN